MPYKSAVLGDSVVSIQKDAHRGIITSYEADFIICLVSEASLENVPKSIQANRKNIPSHILAIQNDGICPSGKIFGGQDQSSDHYRKALLIFLVQKMGCEDHRPIREDPLEKNISE